MDLPFFRSFRFRITLLVTFIFVGVSGLVSLLVYFQLFRVLLASERRQALARAELLLEKVELQPLTIPLPTESEAIQVILETEDSVQVLFTSPQFRKFRPEEQDFYGSNPVIKVEKQATDLRELILFFSYTHTDLAQNLYFLRWLLISGILLSGLLFASFVYLACHRFLLPLQQLTEATRRLSLSAWHQPVKVPQTGDEVQQLAQTFNQMLDRIRTEVEKQNHFFASASHELRTPLAIMQTETQVRLMEGNLPDDLKTLLENQLFECKRLQQLVEDFLMVSSLRKTQLPLSLHLIPLDELLLKAVDRYTHVWHYQQLKAEISIDPRPSDFIVRGDEGKLFTVLSNLFDNASKYAPIGDQLAIRLYQNGTEEVVLEIENTLNRQLMDASRLTEAFYQTDTLAGGFGMGLWISQQIISLHQARLEILHQQERFRVSLHFPAIGE
jgi:signal transduction histidine kinase